MTGKPWEDGNGAMLPEEALRDASRTWTSETWEEFLSQIEQPQTELQIERYERLLERSDRRSSLLEHFSERYEFGDADGPDPVALTEAFFSLSRREQDVVRAVFYEGMSQLAAAAHLGMSQPRVCVLLDQALKKLRARLSPGN